MYELYNDIDKYKYISYACIFVGEIKHVQLGLCDVGGNVFILVFTLFLAQN